MNKVTGQRLKMLRESKGLSQQALADSIGVAKSTISMMEGSKRAGNSKTIKKLADFFNVSTNYIEGRVTQEDNFRDLLLNFTKNDEIPDDLVPVILKTIKDHVKNKSQD